MSLRYAPQTFEPARSQDPGSRGVQFRRALQAMPASEREAAMKPPRPLQYTGGQGEADAVHATAAKGVAGAGLLGASWQGLGSGLAQWLTASKTHLAGAGLLLLALNLLFLRLLRPSSRNAEARKSR